MIIVKMALSLVAVILVCLSGNVVDGRLKLIIDHDGGADDAMAIFMALLYEKYFNGPIVLAITTTHGNVNEDQTFINTQRILDIAERREVPIYRGSNHSLVISVPWAPFFGVDGLGDNEHEPVPPIEAQPQHAALAIIELAKKYPGEIKLVTLGSLTNLALALQLDPELLSRFWDVYIAAGTVHSDIEPDAEFNAEQDVESYYAVMQKSNPDNVTIVPFSQVKSINVTRDWRSNVLGNIPTKIIANLNNFERISIEYSDAWILLDAIAMAAVLNEGTVDDIKYSQNSIILCGEQRGINTNNFTTLEHANVRVINQIVGEVYQNLLVSIFSAELPK